MAEPEFQRTKGTNQMRRSYEPRSPGSTSKFGASMLQFKNGPQFVIFFAKAVEMHRWLRLLTRCGAPDPNSSGLFRLFFPLRSGRQNRDSNLKSKD